MDLINQISISLHDSAGQLALLLLIIPLISSVAVALLPDRGSQNPGLISCIIHALGFFVGLYLFREIWNSGTWNLHIPWLLFGPEQSPFSIELIWNYDNASILMSMVVYLISLLVQMFSIYYMKGDSQFKKYFVYLGLFTFSMLGIVHSGNLLITFMFWELVGFSSYLLIGFWFTKTSAAKAGRKAFIVNRIGDLGFVLALMIIWAYFGTFDIEIIKFRLSEAGMANLSSINGLSRLWLSVAGFGLLFGAIGKSAQFPLLVWLPDAMEGPTPVSALIHAATMVAAGVYLLFRLFVLLTLPVLDFIAFTGMLTAFMAAVAALTQFDIKKVLAYSTISQLGYMMMGLGVGVREAALMHLFTHAFFKAGLFLCAGIIIKSVHDKWHKTHPLEEQIDSQDMRLLGGLKKEMPLVFIVFLILSGSLVGFPLLSGFISKDAIITGTITWGIQRGLIYSLVPIMSLVTALLTVLYITRAIMLTFFGNLRLRGPEKKIENVEQGSPVAKFVIVTLAILSLGLVFSINPLSIESSWVYKGIMLPSEIIGGNLDALKLYSRILEMHQFHVYGLIGSLSMLVTGILIALYRFRYFRRSHYIVKPDAYDHGLFYKLSLNNWYLDRFYNGYVVSLFNITASVSSWIDVKIIDRIVDFLGIFNVVLAHVIAWIDREIIDGLVHLFAWLTRFFGHLFRKMHNGVLQSYYIWVLFIIITVILIWVI